MRKVPHMVAARSQCLLEAAVSIGEKVVLHSPVGDLRMRWASSLFLEGTHFFMSEATALRTSPAKVRTIQTSISLRTRMPWPMYLASSQDLRKYGRGLCHTDME